MKVQHAFSSVTFLLVVFAAPVFAQGETDTLGQEPSIIITMLNGDEYIGEILEKSEDRILLRTENGDISLIESNIKSMDNYDYQGKFRFANPMGSRYFVGPTGLPDKKGQGYFQNVIGVLNIFNYGLTNNISVGGGLELTSLISGNPVWFFMPKIGFDLSRMLHVGGGVFMMGGTGGGLSGLGYGAFTIGHEETNLSVGAGYSFADGEGSSSPAFILSGTHRLGNSIALISENYFFPDDTDTTPYVGIHGIRLLRKKTSFDFGVMIFPEIFGTIPILPYVGYVWIF